MHFDQYLVWLDAVAFFDVPGNRNVRIDLLECFVEPRLAAEYCGLARDHMAARLLRRLDHQGGQIASADVFGEGGTDVFGNFCGRDKWLVHEVSFLEGRLGVSLTENRGFGAFAHRVLTAHRQSRIVAMLRKQ